MKQLTLLLLLFSGVTFGQVEKLNPLQTNQSLHKKEKRNLDQQFIYFFDTLDLPIRDDFARDKFVPYDAQASDANVQDTIHHLLWDLTNTAPIAMDSFALDTTFTYVYDTLSTADSVVFTRTAFAPVELVHYDLCVYPFTFDTLELWPPYDVHDSSLMITGDMNDTTWLVDIRQDSSTIYLVSPTLRDTNFIWVDKYACRNSRYAINPPTVGVATFDGLNENGYPYDFTSVGAPYGEADFLTSKPINMAGHESSTTVLSFFYQPTGLGEVPEIEDSLVVELWAPDSSEWFYFASFANTGLQEDTFYYAHLEIPQTDLQYYKDGFRFRFKNYGSLAGNLDHWHIDYVYLNDRPLSDSIFADVAFQYESYGILNDYTSMPWKHYKWDPDFYTVDTSYMVVNNMNNITENLFEGTAQMYTKFEGVKLDSIAFSDAGNPNIAAGIFKDVIYPKIGFELDTSVNDTCATFQICHSIETDNAPLLQLNDTVTYDQVLSNYYAYDDGSAEWAWGIWGSGAFVAYQYDVMQADSIRSIMIHWAPSVEDVSQKLIRLTIWEDDGAGKPGSIIYQTPALHGESPIYSNDKNGFVEYFLKDASGNDGLRVEVNGTYYIGWAKSDPDVLNIGFDRNRDNSDRIFYNTGSFWTNTGFDGSLMMRPVFVSDKDGFLSVNEPTLEEIDFTVYPNPTEGQLRVAVESAYDYTYAIQDLNGRMLQTGNATDVINTDSFVAGMYIITLKKYDGTTASRKFLKR